MNFDQLISPFSLKEFQDNYLEKAVCFSSRKNPAYYDSLIDQQYLRSFLLNGGFRASECRLVKENSDLSPYMYTTGPRKKTGFATADMDRFVDTAKVMSLYAEGYSISLMGMDRYHPSLAILKNQLNAELCAHISMNLYVSPDNETGLPTHDDPHDVLVLQIYGSKSWQIFDEETTLPLPGQTNDDHSRKQVVKSFVLEQGDFAYVPRGFAHRATTFSRPSIHLTIGISRVTYLDVFQQLMKQLSISEKEMRASLRSFGQSGQESALLQNLIGILMTSKASEAMTLALDSLETKLIDDISPVHQLGMMSMDLLNRNLSLRSIIQVTNPEFVKFRKRNGISTLLYPGQSLSVHSLLEPLVTSIVNRKHTSFTVDAVVDAAQQEAQIQFLKFLVKDGFLQILRVDDE